jgi:alkanesulfonate monooxygenase
MASENAIKIFTTCPVSAAEEPKACRRRLEDVAVWSEQAGCEGILVFSDNRQLDAWLVSQAIIGVTHQLCPLVAIQPAYMHPYSVAKMITSLAFLYGRRTYLNMVAGGFTNDLAALNDATPHDERYVRLVEYTSIVQSLLRSAEPVSFEGKYYRVTNLKLAPALPAELMPGVFVSGSSAAGQDAARALGATAVEYPTNSAPSPAATSVSSGGRGIRIGVIARGTDDEAWAVAHGRYPEDRKGQLTRKLASKVSDSSWHQQLTTQADTGTDDAQGPYWLVPFQNYKAMCPYLVGSYERIAGELASYVDRGFTTFILDEPSSEEEMRHVATTFELVTQRRAAA